MATNLDQQITTPAPPNLGAPSDKYDERFFGQSFGALNAYFIKLTNLLSALFGPRGGKWLNAPYGAFQDNQTRRRPTRQRPMPSHLTPLTSAMALPCRIRQDLMCLRMEFTTCNSAFNSRTPPTTRRMWMSGFARTAQTLTNQTADLACQPENHLATRLTLLPL